ncbi:MAG: hypothetical protein ACJAZ3_001270 [Sphingobacteriales bacterium]|jgi:hypothetical protein
MKTTLTALMAFLFCFVAQNSIAQCIAKTSNDTIVCAFSVSSIAIGGEPTASGVFCSY